MISSIDTRHLRYFLAVAESLHFRHAADMLHLSQPSLSQQIQQMEEDLGVKLFERTRRHVQLTAAGAALAIRARSILRSMDEAVQEAKRADQGLAGQITMSFVSTALVGILPRAMKKLQSTTPGVVIELKECEPTEQIAYLLQESVDIGFMHAKLEEKSLTSCVIQRDRLIAAVPEEFASPDPVDLSDFAHMTSIMPSPFSTFGFFNHVQRAYQLAGVVPLHSIYANLLIGAIHLASAGIGIALVPSSFCSVRIPGIVYRELAIAPPPVELLAVWKKDSSSKVLQRFLTLLRKESRAHPEADVRASVER